MSKIYPFLIMLIILVLFHGIPLYSREGDSAKYPEFSINFLTSLNMGRFDEIVYDLSGLPNRNNTEYLSHLQWEIMPIVLPGLRLVIKYKPVSLLSIMISGMGTLENVGQMNNYDWLYTNRNWSHWSQHKTWLKWVMMARIEYQWQIYGSDVFSLNTGLGYYFNGWSLGSSVIQSRHSTLDPDKKYPAEYKEGQPYRDIHNKVTSDMGTINYKVIHHIPFALLLASLEAKKFVFRIGFTIGPVFGFGTDEHIRNMDNSVTQKVIFEDSITAGPWLGFFLKVSFSLNPYLSALLEAEYDFFHEARGNAVEKKMGKKNFLYGAAGMAYNILIFKIGLKWIF